MCRRKVEVQQKFIITRLKTISYIFHLAPTAKKNQRIEPIKVTLESRDNENVISNQNKSTGRQETP
jgi:hypothetical protein